MLCFQKLFLFLSRPISNYLQDIEKGKHDDEKCEEYHREYREQFGKDLEDCEYKGNKSKIQNLMRKIKIDAAGNVTEVQFKS